MFAAIALHIDKKKDADRFFEKILSFNLNENILFDLLGIAETLGKLSEFADS